MGLMLEKPSGGRQPGDRSDRSRSPTAQSITDASLIWLHTPVALLRSWPRRCRIAGGRSLGPGLNSFASRELLIAGLSLTEQNVLG